MCEDVEGFSTVVGRRRDIVALGEMWRSLLTPDAWGLRDEPPEHIDLTRLGGDAKWQFADENSPAVAVVRHPSGTGVRVCAGLQAEVLAGHPHHGLEPLTSLLLEPGFYFRAAQAGTGPTVNLDPTKVRQVALSAPRLTGKIGGARVALVDTGLTRPNETMADFTAADARTVPADDPNGHGTAMAQVIEAVNAGANIYPVRVLGADKRGPSHEVFAGMNFVLWSGEFDIVNASITTDSGGNCATSFGKSLDYLLALSRTSKGSSPPRIVAAAGNMTGVGSGYPAVLSGAVVAVALESDGSGGYVRAGYNSTPPPGQTVMEAYGGSDTDPLGDITPTGSQIPVSQWGTSIAAAAVTGAFVP